MKIQCNREQLLKAFLSVAGVASVKSPKEILNNVKFVAGPDGLCLHATDMELWIIAPVEGVDVIKPGAALLPVGRFGQMLKEMPDETVTIEAEETQTHIKGAHSQFKLPSANPDEYPSVKTFDADNYHGVMSRLLANAIKKTVFATDPDSSRFALGGIKIELEGTEGRVIGTDGRRLGCVEFGVTPINGHSTAGLTSVIVPSRASAIIQRACDAFDGECRVSCTTNEISVDCGGVVIGSRLVEGRYPNWRQVIPIRNENWSKVEIPAGAFGSIVRQAAIVADKETRGLDFTFNDGTLIVGAQAAELGESTIEMPVEWEGDRLKIKLDFRFVGNFVSVLSPDEKMFLELASATQPCVMSSEGYSYVVMPMSQE